MSYPLPTLSRDASLTPKDLVRFYHRVELHWARHLGEETELEMGTSLVNAKLADVGGANCILDAALPEGMSAAAAIEAVRWHFRAAGSGCRSWVMNPSAAPDRVRPLVEALAAAGHTPRERTILYLQGSPGSIAELAGLTIIPARASFRHVRQIAMEMSPQNGATDAALMHLDDPHVDALLALRDGSALGMVSVLSAGDIGGITEIFVSASHRRHGIGRTLLSRALEIAARSLFKHVLTSAAAGNTAARALFRAGGFTPIGTFTEYRAE